MSNFYTKYRRVFFGFLVSNVLIYMLQLAFNYGHLIKHEWWTMCLSLFFASVNGLCAVQQYRQWRRVQREEKDYMWATLSSEIVR